VLRPYVGRPRCVSMLIVGRPAYTRRMEASSRSLARWGAVAACLGGISYGAAGYLDNSDATGFVIGAVVPVLGAATPAFFLGGLSGLYRLPGGGGGLLLVRRAALLVGLVGTVLGLFDELDWWESDRWIPLYAALTAVGLGVFVGLSFWSRRGGGPVRRVALPVVLAGTALGLADGLDWWEPDWWVLLFFALTAAGLELVFEEGRRLVGASVLASGALGGVSLLTDPASSEVLVPARPVHVAFAALFCLSCLAWGAALFREASRGA
jgi:hypothetical protein